MTNEERDLKIIEMSVHIEYVKEKVDTLASKSSIAWLKWGISGIGGISITALLIACGVF